MHAQGQARWRPIIPTIRPLRRQQQSLCLIAALQAHARNRDATLREIGAVIRSLTNNHYNKAAIAVSGLCLCEAL